jgi:hypothetical protein
LVTILSNEATGKYLQCSYGTWYDAFWPNHQYAWASALINLPSSEKNVKFTFSGNSNSKYYVSVMWFSVGQHLDFIPSDTFREFPYLNGLAIYGLFTTIKNGLFSSHHDRVVYLDFGYSNQVSHIEPQAFQGLINLKRLRVRNQVQHLDANLFETNLKLEYIDFSNNQISSVDRNLYKNLNYLKSIDFTGNPGVIVKLGCATCLITQSQLEEAFGVPETTTSTTTTSTSTLPPTTTTTPTTSTECVPTCCEDLRENVTAILNELNTKFDIIMKHLKTIEKSVNDVGRA